MAVRFHRLSEDYKEVITENAKKVGLDKINFDETYYVTKIKAKSSGRELDEFKIRGVPCLLGNETILKLYFNSISEWFMTSPVVSTEKDGNDYIVETENSTYFLKRA